MAPVTMLNMESMKKSFLLMSDNRCLVQPPLMGDRRSVLPPRKSEACYAVLDFPLEDCGITRDQIYSLI